MGVRWAEQDNYLGPITPLLTLRFDTYHHNFCTFPGDDGFFFHTSEDDVFGHIGDDSLPFTEIAMKDQDKNEDIMEVLSIDVNKKPYFPYLGFYITLAIIKKNNFEASKVDEQFLF